MSDKYTLKEALKLLGIEERIDSPNIPFRPIAPTDAAYFWVKHTSGPEFTNALPLPPEGNQWVGINPLEWDAALKHDCAGWRPMMVGEVFNEPTPVNADTAAYQYWNTIRRAWVKGSQVFVINEKHLHPMRTTRAMPFFNHE